jgi:hypothetical protein
MRSEPLTPMAAIEEPSDSRQHKYNGDTDDDDLPKLHMNLPEKVCLFMLQIACHLRQRAGSKLYER